MKGDCLGELHLLENVLCRSFVVMIYYADTLNIMQIHN